MECMVGLTKQNVLLLFFAPIKGAQMLIATSSGDKGVTNAVTEIEIKLYCCTNGKKSLRRNSFVAQVQRVVRGSENAGGGSDAPRVHRAATIGRGGVGRALERCRA